MANWLWTFQVNSVDVTAYVLKNTKITTSRFMNDENLAEIHLINTVSTVLTPSAGLSVKVTRGLVTSSDDVRFLGNVKEIRYQDNEIVLICRDYITQLKYKLLSISYDRNIDPQAGEVSAIFSDIVSRSGFSPSVVSSGTSSTSYTLDKFNSTNQSYQNRLDLLSQILNWVWYYDYNQNWIRLEPKGYTKYAKTLTVGQNVYNVPDWNQNLEPMRNKITIQGATKLDTRTASFTGDGSTKTFQLLYTVQSIQVTVGGVLKTLGVTGSTSAYDYTLDNDLKQITFVTAPVLSAAIAVTMQVSVLVPVTGYAKDSIATYSLTQEEEYSFSDVVTTDDAETRVEQLLSLLKDGIIDAKLYTDESPIVTGNMVSVVDSLRPDKSGDYLVYSVTSNYPDFTDVLSIGNAKIDVQQLFLTIDQRLKALEKPDNATITILRQLLSLDWSSTWQQRDTKIQHRDTTGDYLWGNTTWNGGLWQATYTNPLTDSKLLQGNNVFEEYVWDSDYYDSGVSTGVTWDTSAKTITITNGYLYTKAITLGETFNLGVFTTGQVTGDTSYATYEVSADGKSTWQTITRGTTTTFTSSNKNGIYLRIGCATVGKSIVIANTYKSGGAYNIPALRLSLA